MGRLSSTNGERVSHVRCGAVAGSPADRRRRDGLFRSGLGARCAHVGDMAALFPDAHTSAKAYRLCDNYAHFLPNLTLNVRRAPSAEEDR